MKLGSNKNIAVEIEGNNPTDDTVSDTVVLYELQTRLPLKHRVISSHIRGERSVLYYLGRKADGSYVALHFRKEAAQIQPLRNFK